MHSSVFQQTDMNHLFRVIAEGDTGLHDDVEIVLQRVGNRVVPHGRRHEDLVERIEVFDVVIDFIPNMLLGSVQLFGGWVFSEEDASSPNLARRGYDAGVPMGGTLRPVGDAPTFLVGALKDPLSGHLDRVQIIKGWLGADGETHEKVYNVAWSDAHERALDQQGDLPAVGNSVNVEEATWTNSIGDAQLIGFWRDPAFDPTQPAFYYARVIEIATPRWTAHDAKVFGVEPPEGARMVLQERAYTSPIWHTPQKH